MQNDVTLTSEGNKQDLYFCKDCGKGSLGKDHIHTCSPQVKRDWIGLTDAEEIELDEKYGDDIDAYIDARDAKLKELNT